MCRTHLRTLYGDVTGDGQPDAIRVTGSSSPTGVCHVTLEVSSGGHRIRTAVVGPSDGGAGPPGSFELVRLDHLPALEIVVLPWSGASTGFARLYVVRSGRLWNVRAPRPVDWDGLFPFSGSMGENFGVDCAHDGLIDAAAVGLVHGSRYSGTRLYLRLHADRLVVVPRLTVHTRSRHEFALRGLTSTPFPSCTVAKSGRFR
jgi:hypothetical protein